MFGFREVDAAEVAFGEYHTVGAQSAQVIVTEVVTVELALGPKCFVFGHAVSRAAA